MKKFTLAILTTVIAFAPLAALAQNTNTSIQSNSNSATSVGHGNTIFQNSTQTSVQDQLHLGGYGASSTPNSQTSVQVNANEAAAIGNGNTIIQDANQTNVQSQVDIERYLPFQY